MLLCLQIHLVHWNEEMYESYSEAVKHEDGIVIVAVFVKVCIPTMMQNHQVRMRRVCEYGCVKNSVANNLIKG